MRISLSAGLLLAAVAVSGFGIRTSAAPIAALNPLGDQSTVVAFAIDDNDAGTQTNNDVNSLPYSTPATVTDGENSSTTTPTLSNSALNFAFSQAIVDTAGYSQTEGNGNIYFTAGANTTFSIAGSITVVGDFIDDGRLVTSLYDITTGTYLYNYSQVVGPIVGSDTLTLDTSGGSLTGSLAAGQDYEFLPVAEMNKNESGDSGLTGSVGISFTQSPSGPIGGSSVPLPSAATSGLAALLGLGIALVYRRKIANA